MTSSRTTKSGTLDVSLGDVFKFMLKLCVEVSEVKWKLF